MIRFKPRRSMMSSEIVKTKAKELERKFNEEWGPFTRSLAGRPKTALAIGAAAGFLVAAGLAFIF